MKQKHLPPCKRKPVPSQQGYTTLMRCQLLQDMMAQMPESHHPNFARDYIKTVGLVLIANDGAIVDGHMADG